MPSSWTKVDSPLPALTYTYSFGPGLATSLAVMMDGGLALVSPPCNVPDSVYSDLEAHGKLRALVAPNAYHTMGLAPWKERYPDVPVFAPAAGIARVEKQTKLSGIRPTSELAGLAGDKVEVVEIPGFKLGEVLVRWRVEGGDAWYVTDVLFNWPSVPKGLVGLVFKWSRSAPGLRRNALTSLFAMKDKRAAYAWLVEQAEKAPPKLIVPCHGQVMTLADPVAEIRAAVS